MVARLNRLLTIVDYPIEFIYYITVQLGANQPLFGREHIMLLRVTGASGIEKSMFTLFHYKKLYTKWPKNGRYRGTAGPVDG
jgi:hypothetical protein